MTSPRPLSLLQAMAGAAQGGAEAFFERLAVALHQAGLPQHLLIRRAHDRAARLRQAGLTVTELPFGGAFDWRTGWRFRQAVGEFQPTHVLTWMNRATRHCPRLPAYIPHLARLGGYYDLKYYRRCDLLIGNTPDLVQYFQANGWPAAQTAYVPNFAAPPAPTPLPPGLTRPTDGWPLIVALGRLHPNKGFDTLLTALAELPEVTLWLVGDGPLRSALAAQAATLPQPARIHFLGWQANVTPFLQAATVFVCPSRHEPLGNVILEAWAHGVPVVATASEGPRQLIVPEVSGLLSPVDDAAALAAALRRMLGDSHLRQQCAAGGLAQYQAQFSEPAVVRHYLELLEQTAR